MKITGYKMEVYSLKMVASGGGLVVNTWAKHY